MSTLTLPHRLHRVAPCALAIGLALATLGTAQAQTTTLGTRGLTSQPNPAITSNSDATWPAYTRAERYAGAKTLPLQFITLSNGKKLGVYVSLPANALGMAASGKFPVVLTQTAYRIDMSQLMGVVSPGDTTLLIGGLDKFMVKRGYITVAVDSYGTGMSEGVTELLGEEEQKAYGETVNWITKQPWFNGSIGVAGTSYLGITSLLTAGQGHPAIKAAFAEVPMGDAFRGTVGTGGLLNAQFLATWLPLTQTLSVTNQPAQLLHPQHATQIGKATKDHVAAINAWYFPTIDRGLAGEVGIATDDGSFWSVRSPIEKTPQIKVPTFVIGASADIFQRDEPLIYEQLKRNVTTKLVIHPGYHLQSVLTAAKDHNNATEQGSPGSAALLLQWFDQYVMGLPAGADKLPNVTQHVDGYGESGKSRYAISTDWPHPQMNPQRWYLRGDRVLRQDAPAAADQNQIVIEPPAPTVTKSTILGGTVAQAKVTLRDSTDCSNSHAQWTLGMSGLLPKDCQKDSRQVEEAQGSIVYESAPLASDLYLNGPIQADVWMRASKTQAAVSVRVDVVDPSAGTVKPLTNGLQSAAFRAVDTSRSRLVNGVMIQPWHPFTQASIQAVVPGQPMLVPVEVFPTAALIRAGQKLRVAISASNQAQGIWSLDRQAEADGNVSTILSSPAYPSSIVLPVVPRSALK